MWNAYMNVALTPIRAMYEDRLDADDLHQEPARRAEDRAAFLGVLPGAA